MDAPHPPTLAEVPVAVPFYLRFLRNAKAWGDTDTPLEIRVEEVLQRAFKIDDPEHSLFWVENEVDYRRAVVSLYSKRQRPTGNFLFVPIRPSELANAGVVIRRHPEDETPCSDANSRLHYNATADENQLRALCKALLEGGRGTVRLVEKAVGTWLVESKLEGCMAGTREASCLVLGCPARIG